MRRWIRLKNFNKNYIVFRIINLILMALISLASIGMLIYYVKIGDPNKRLLPCIGISLLPFIPLLIELIFRRRFSNLLFLGYQIYILLAGFLGSVVNLYEILWWYDIFIHTMFGYVICIIGLLVISKIENYKKLNIWTVILFCFVFSLAVELMWELLEWLLDSTLGLTMQGAPADGHNAPLVLDTDLDLLCNFSGALIFTIQFIIGKFSKCSMGVNFIEKELIHFKDENKEDLENVKNEEEKENKTQEEIFIEDKTQESEDKKNE